MKTVDIQMEIAYDIEEKKITSIQPYGGNVALPEKCVVCNQPSTREVPLLLDVEGLGSSFEYQQRMPYCLKHQLQLSLLRLLNIMPAIFTIGLTVYLFILLGGFGGGRSTRFNSSGIFLAFFLGAVFYFFLKPKLRSFRNGTSGTGVRLVHNNPSKEFRVEDHPVLLRFLFTNDEFAVAIVRKNQRYLQMVEDENSEPTG